MPSYKKSEVIDFIKASGCIYLRDKGDHTIFQCGSEQISIPLHGYSNTVFEGIVQESIKKICRHTGMSYKALNNDISNKGMCKVIKNLEKFGINHYKVSQGGVAQRVYNDKTNNRG